jgi:hypothetical protein
MHKSSRPPPCAQTAPTIIPTCPYENFLLEDGGGPGLGGAGGLADNSGSCTGLDSFVENEFMLQLEGANVSPGYAFCCFE